MSRDVQELSALENIYESLIEAYETQHGVTLEDDGVIQDHLMYLAQKQFENQREG